MAEHISDIDLRETILTNELGDRMLNMVAPIYDRSKLFLYIFQAIGTVLEKDMKFAEEDLIAQMFPQTTTWGINLWEREYGIIPDPSWDLEQRRKNLVSAMQYKAPITPKKIADRVSAMTGLEASVQENVAPNTIRVIIESYTPNYEEVNRVLDKILPAHLCYETNINDNVNSEAVQYYGIVMNEVETVDVIIK